MRLNFDVPMNWTFPTVDKLIPPKKGAIKIGPFGSSLKKAEYSESGIRVIGIDHVHPNKLVWKKPKYIPPAKYEELTQYTVQTGDVLVTNMGTVGRTCFVPDDFPKAIISSHLIKVSPDFSKVEPSYLCWALNFCPIVVAQIRAKCQGAIMAGFNTSLLKSIHIPLPPLEDQRRIAAILDKADTVRRKRQEAIALTEELLRSAFLEMFGDPDTNQKGWEMKPLGEVCSRVTVGFVGTMALEYIEEGIPWLRSLNVKRNRITLNDLKYVSTNFHERVIKSSLSPGDVVAVRTGNAGVAAVVPTSISHANCADLIVMTCGSELVPTYLSETLNLLLGDRDGGTGLTGAIQKHFNIARAKQLMIPLPPLYAQENWATLVNQLERLQLTQEKDKEETHALFNSLLQRAFQGEL